MGQALVAIGAIIIVAVLVSSIGDGSREGARTHICARCLTVTGGRSVLPGSGWITFLLAWLLLVPALIYMIWRRSARRYVCPRCGSEELVPVDTPRGREMAGRGA